jgi:hypothetical protein
LPFAPITTTTSSPTPGDAVVEVGICVVLVGAAVVLALVLVLVLVLEDDAVVVVWAPTGLALKPIDSPRALTARSKAEATGFTAPYRPVYSHI